MTKGLRLGRSLLATLVLVFFMQSRASAEAENRVRAQAKWDQSKLVINVADVLTPAQREIINSGFTTFSVFSIGDPNDKNATAYRLSCTVKYDTWEDRYDVSKLDPPPTVSETVKDYKSWSNMCLEVVIDDPKVIATLEQQGEVNALLNIRQSTPEEGAKIKSWLVKQQSGFMQGLYSHMLGDFQYLHKSNVRVIIPKKIQVKPPQGSAKS